MEPFSFPKKNYKQKYVLTYKQSPQTTTTTKKKNVFIKTIPIFVMDMSSPSTPHTPPDHTLLKMNVHIKYLPYNSEP